MISKPENLTSNSNFNIAIYDIVVGVQIFLLISFLRSFIFTSIVYILDFLELTQEIGAFLAILPSIFILLVKINNEKIRYTIPIIIWLIIIISPFTALNYILLLLGMTIVFSNLSYILSKSVSYNPAMIVFWFVGIDLGLKTLNFGTDPVIAYNLPSFLVSFGLGIYIIWIITKETSFIQQTPKNKEVSSIKYFITLSTLIFNITIYYLYFANPGSNIFVLNNSTPLSITVFYLVSMIVVILFIMLTNNLLKDNLETSIIFAIFLILSIFTRPWFDFYFIFWILGLFANLYFIYVTLNTLTKITSIYPEGLFSAVTILNVGFIFMIISDDHSSFPIIFTVVSTSIYILFEKFRQGGRNK